MISPPPPTRGPFTRTKSEHESYLLFHAKVDEICTAHWNKAERVDFGLAVAKSEVRSGYTIRQHFTCCDVTIATALSGCGIQRVTPGRDVADTHHLPIWTLQVKRGAIKPIICISCNRSRICIVWTDLKHTLSPSNTETENTSWHSSRLFLTCQIITQFVNM